jgi:hypothetical protein
VTVDDWHDLAACKGATALWYPERGHQATVARLICSTCPVSGPCLAEALADESRHGVEAVGIRAGLTPRERRQLRRASAPETVRHVAV